MVAEFGGRWAAVATALCSALSLDFFLTKPYLRLTIDEKHDVIAFVGLAVCGVVAAVLGSRRGERIASRKNLDLLHSALRQLQGAGPLEPRLTKVLNACRAALPLAAVVVRNDHGQLMAASERSHAMPVPAVTLEPEILLAPGTAARDLPRRGPPFSKEGGRLPLVRGIARSAGSICGEPARPRTSPLDGRFRTWRASWPCCSRSPAPGRTRKAESARSKLVPKTR